MMIFCRDAGKFIPQRLPEGLKATLRRIVHKIFISMCLFHCNADGEVESASGYNHQTMIFWHLNISQFIGFRCVFESWQHRQTGWREEGWHAKKGSTLVLTRGCILHLNSRGCFTDPYFEAEAATPRMCTSQTFVLTQKPSGFVFSIHNLFLEYKTTRLEPWEEIYKSATALRSSMHFHSCNKVKECKYKLMFVWAFS